MKNERKTLVCPSELAGSLDNIFRKLAQNPMKILTPYIREGMIVLDLGCGPGFFTVPIATMLGGRGKVIAADLQEGMLQKLRKKINGSTIEKNIVLHKCSKDSSGVTEKVDFILLFYAVHEFPDQDKLFAELKSILKPDGRIFISEPYFHVTRHSFNVMIKRLLTAGFEITERPKLALSRTIVLKKIYKT